MEKPAQTAVPTTLILDPPDGGIAVVVLTHNRVQLLEKCVENVLSRTSDSTTEIVIWNNASTDETRQYLDSLDDSADTRHPQRQEHRSERIRACIP